ncbi:ribosomal protein l7/l12, mitochondrial/apicoplast, putative [Theileria annulata]|uniref:Ribosomal protein l7/l12, mitochondrial/apicoplast, putative n=1 Tax=Theileria annulata TaxID=5874 RepID=Q4UFU5_THEAN|nr:ribosomal protein l7/l12, mitochondrial/apicoplast, putative [Theileria annulata]CAI74213.1 ribosomal protein l7/l12, mitochondrial/apicoplast, putative [Theileria annulata]|eukprot:XP_951945.1 ribosomal protein l7/l12, mitochondrial/apicoplast, putative [Theileria annulata]
MFLNRLLIFKTINNLNRRNFTTFDVFKKLQDSNTDNGKVDEETRKPSLKVIKLVDEILNLTLIEVADLCNLCQDKLSTKNIGNRLPFPHPNSFFQYNGFVGGNMNFTPPPPSPSPTNTSDSTPKEANASPKEEVVKEKAPLKRTIKLVGFDKEKKIDVIKTIRTILNISLRESKELIESYPKVIKKSTFPQLTKLYTIDN